ncbi:hypothetical protein KFE25_004500 [Diacronema lutheri]|uniref:Uncharacterized protein n=2 Tax=Diacronema lutheri TaxID=2081491 RepID=A0A8J6C2X9_DIALT|nr:hypothetical protein KFE25_004500 [Diacronema lutheri]
MPVSRGALLAAWSTAMCAATMALLAMDVHVRSKPALPPALHDDASPTPFDALHKLDGPDGRARADGLKSTLNSMAERLPSFLDRLDADLQRSTSELSDTQHVLASAQSHVREVMGDRATLPELDLDSPGAAARNGEVMQAWLRDLSDVLPDLFAAMEGDVRELKGVLQPSIQPRGSASAQR